MVAKRDAPSYGVYILAYEWIIEKLLDRRKGEVPTPFQSIWVGGIAGWEERLRVGGI